MRFVVSACLALGLFAAPAAWAQSIEEMAGQMVMVGFSGTALDDSGVRAIRDQVGRGEIGGVMYLRTNVESLAAVRAINGALVSARPWLPPFIALDQEGGQIERLTAGVGFEEIPSARNIARDTPDAARVVYQDLAVDLAREGFNLNFGPVVDLDLNPANPIIARYQRAYGDDPETVSAFAAAFVEGHHQAGMATALKHFPGHGSSRDDSHEGFVDITGLWQPVELEPYRSLIGAGLADMVMVAHLFNADIQRGDADQLPASLSQAWIGGVLRNELGYDGVVITDDLEMAAIRSRFDLHDTIVRAVEAGVDILLFSNTAAYDPELGPEISEILVAEADGNPAFAERIAQSYARIIALKRDVGIIP
ncbi:glycoside hydrolase family 3 N-terminal domain-containing protein [Pelagibacterium mangrovi]|uniref:glycoside hydrolase family 3 N-terminal domain-containing protein n=1 Tax=Pelagibacterium mangrovi TaxID=3119828 RepID=UPI002FC7BB66